MAKASQNLASMTVDALLKLRDEIGGVLSQKSQELKRQLASLASTGRAHRVGNPRVSSMKGRKVAPKYRGPDGELWAGRGAKPRWLQAAIREGAKQDDFLIAKATRKRSAATKSRKRKAA